ncbi:hypothetical protein R0J90_19105, partial [Micrococcus sp. SIMBA_144]
CARGAAARAQQPASNTVVDFIESPIHCGCRCTLLLISVNYNNCDHRKNLGKYPYMKSTTDAPASRQTLSASTLDAIKQILWSGK